MSQTQAIIGWDNGLSPERHQAIIWTNTLILLIKIHTFSFMKMHVKMSSGEWWPSCLGFNVSLLLWRHNGNGSDSNHQPHECLLNRLFRRRSKKTSKLRVTGLCAGKSPGTGEFPAQMASYAENVSIWCSHHVKFITLTDLLFMPAFRVFPS